MSLIICTAIVFCVSIVNGRNLSHRKISKIFEFLETRIETRPLLSKSENKGER